MFVYDIRIDKDGLAGTGSYVNELPYCHEEISVLSRLFSRRRVMFCAEYTSDGQKNGVSLDEKISKNY